MGRSVSKRIGVLGGTFSPVHNGHLYIAGQALVKLRLNKVIFIPARVPPHKKIREQVKISDRVRMLRLALKGKKHFSVSEYEIRRKGASYSIRTAMHLKRKFGKAAQLFFLIGADSLAGLKDWKEISKLMNILQFVLIPRPGFKAGSGNKDIMELEIPGKDISSSEIRRRAAKGKPIKGLTPKVVCAYIEKNKLFRS